MRNTKNQLDQDKFILIRTPKFIKIVDEIDKNIDYVDSDPIFDCPINRGAIDRALKKAYDEFGRQVTNDLIESFNLHKLGWKRLSE